MASATYYDRDDDDDVILMIIKFHEVYLCAESTAVGPITEELKLHTKYLNMI
jgi:hypothetical protein